jgi:uncharacterized protein
MYSLFAFSGCRSVRSSSGIMNCVAVSPASQLVCTGLWRWVQNPGLERFEVHCSSANWIFRGAILTAAAETRYEIMCDSSFLTRAVSVCLRDSIGERTLQLSAENGVWRQGGFEQAAVRGALDVDLGWSPSTNTLPIRRLQLPIGQSSGELIAAWVRFPELTLEPLRQEYFRVSELTYRYSSRNGAFTALLTVDEHGLVLDYEGFWERITS